jgi:hypothetical protein
MELRTKKILLIFAFLTSIVAIGLLLWFFFFKPTPSEILPTEEVVVPGEFPTTGEGGAIPIVGKDTGGKLPVSGAGAVPTKPVISPIARGGITKVKSVVDAPTKDAVLAKNGRDIAYYDRNTNKFYKIDENGNIVELSDKQFFNVEKTNWAKDISKAIIEYPDKSKIMYDFEKEKQYTIPKHWEGFDFSPNSEQIITKSIGIDRESRWLAISNADGSQAQRIEPLGDNGAKVDPKWSPTNQIVATYVEGRNLYTQDVYFIGKNKENFKSATVEGRGFESAWSPTGSHLLYSVYNSESGYKPTLWITEASGERIGFGRMPLELNTWAKKCTFASTDKIYCAVPTSLEEGSGLIPEIADTTPDNLYEIDLASGSKKLIAIPEKEANMRNIMVSSDGRKLFYTDGATGQILQIDLK